MRSSRRLPMYVLILVGGSGVLGCEPSASPVERADAPRAGSQALEPSPECMTIQRGATGSMEETQIQKEASPQYPDKQFGAFRTMSVGTGEFGPREVLIRPSPGPLPPILKLVSATLIMPVESASTATIRMSRVLVPWDEGKVTWESFHTTPSAIDDTLVYGVSAAPGIKAINIDVTDLAFDVGQGTVANHGLLLQGNGEYTTFYTSESTVPGTQPSLHICFIPDRCAGVACQVKDTCTESASCDPSTGACIGKPKADGAACDDGNAGTTGDTCTNAVCLGTSAGGGITYQLFANGPGFACPTGSTVWVSAMTRDPKRSEDAQAACEACYGVGQCYLSDEDGAGLAWGPSVANKPACDSAYFGFTDGSTGDAGRSFVMCKSSSSFGDWGK